MSKYTKIFLKLFLTISLLFWFISKTDLTGVYRSLLALSWQVLILVNMISLLSVLFNTWKWNILLPEQTTLRLFKINLISYVYSMLLPGQIAGEAAKTYILGKGKKEAEKIAASVVIDKITGIIGLLLVGILGIAFTRTSLPKSLTIVLIAGVIMTIIILLSMRANRLYGLIISYINYLGQRFRKASIMCKRVGYLIDAWHAYAQKPSILMLSISLGIVHQMLAVIITMVLAHQMGILISFFDWCWILGVLAFALILPLTIGGIGIRESTIVSILGWYGIPIERALALSFSLFGLLLIIAFIGAFIQIGKVQE